MNKTKHVSHSRQEALFSHTPPPNPSALKIVWQYDLTNLTQQEIIVILWAIAVNKQQRQYIFQYSSS